MQDFQNLKEKIAILSPVLLVASIIYDYIYYLKMGIEFKHLPISATDSYHTLIGSIPLILVLLLSNFLIELIFMRTEKGETQEELLQKIHSSKLPKFNMIFHFGYEKLIRLVFILMSISPIIFGDHLMPPPLALGIGAILIWNILFTWISGYERFEKLFSEAINTFIKFGLPYIFFFCAYGYSQSTIDIQSATHGKSNASIETTKNQFFPVLRVIDKGAIIFHKEVDEVQFIPFDQIQKVVIRNNNTNFQGLLPWISDKIRK